VARQYPRKHIADLLRALPIVRRAVPGAHAIIAGDGPEHGNLRALVAELKLHDAVRFTGALPDDDLALLYRQADHH
jgi:glycosyltransferase involved in cell wall biosynthesis